MLLLWCHDLCSVCCSDVHSKVTSTAVPIIYHGWHFYCIKAITLRILKSEVHPVILRTKYYHELTRSELEYNTWSLRSIFQRIYNSSMNVSYIYIFITIYKNMSIMYFCTFIESLKQDKIGLAGSHLFRCIVLFFVFNT